MRRCHRHRPSTRVEAASAQVVNAGDTMCDVHVGGRHVLSNGHPVDVSTLTTEDLLAMIKAADNGVAKRTLKFRSADARVGKARRRLPSWCC